MAIDGNVVKNYDWTSAPVGSSIRKEAPRVWLKSYKIDSNQILMAINGFVALAEGTKDAKTFYEQLYGESTTPEDDFWFPYFGDSVRGFSNTFGDTFQSGLGGAGGILGNQFEEAKTFAGGIAQTVNMVNDPNAIKNTASAIMNLKGSGTWKDVQQAASKLGTSGTYVETPMFYQFEKNDDPLNISFVLANTINPEAYTKNLNLIQHLIKINRPLRKSSIEVEPPRIYKVRLHGLRFIRWAYCSAFDVKLLGTKREINKTIVPEAYEISMTLTSLTLEHAGFMDQVNK